MAQGEAGGAPEGVVGSVNLPGEAVNHENLDL